MEWKVPLSLFPTKSGLFPTKSGLSTVYHPQPCVSLMQKQSQTCYVSMGGVSSGVMCDRVCVIKGVCDWGVCPGGV